MSIEDKQRFYNLAQVHLRKAVEALRELQILFEEEENAHDMSTVEDARVAVEDVQADVEGLPDHLLSKGLE